MAEEWIKQTGAAPKIIDGVTFTCWKTYDGYVNRYRWRSDDERCVAWSPRHRDSHRAEVDGVALQTKFRSLENAMKAAVKAANVAQNIEMLKGEKQ